MEILFSIVVFIFVIGVMVLVHEWGHYWAARRVGVKVEAFSIGMGPKLVGWQRGETEYKICALPIGGYVKMLGEDPGEEEEQRAGDDPRAFQNRSRLERFFVLIMGPALNILLAFLIWFGLLMVGEQKEAWLLEPPIVQHVNAGSPADQRGIQPGDRIVSINGNEVEDWETLIYTVATNPREEMQLQVERDGSVRQFSIKPEEDPVSGIGSIGASPGYPSEISGLVDGSPADEAGLQNGDIVTAIDGKRVSSFYDVFETVTAITRREAAVKAVALVVPPLYSLLPVLEQQKEMTFQVRRGEEEFTTTVTPEYSADLGFHRIGISRPPMPTITVSAGPLEAVVGAAERCVDMTVRLYDILAKMITGKLSSKAISGPVEIADISGRTAAQGLIPLLNLMAFISLNLGIVNLLPLPVLDGGHITILAIEGTIRRDLNTNVKEWIMRFGVALLLALMVLVISQDIIKLFSR